MQSDFTLRGLFNSDRVKDASGLLEQGSNKAYLEMVESSGVTTKEDIHNLAETYRNFGEQVDPIMEKQAEDWMNLSDEVKKTSSITQNFIDKNASGFSKLGAGLKSIGSTILSTFGKAALSAGITWLVTEGISLVAKAGKWLWDEVLTDNGKNKRRDQAVTDLQTKISDYNSEIEGINKVSESYENLSEKLQDANISADEFKATKAQLKGIQDELYDTFGKEAEGIDLVNGKYEEQLELLNKIKSNKGYEFLYGDNGALKVGKDGKTSFEQNLDIINEKATKKSGDQIVLSNDMWNLPQTDGTAEQAVGFDIESVLEKYSALSFEKGEYYAEVGLPFHFKIDPNVTKKEAQEQLDAFFADLDRLYPNNKEVQAFKKQLGSDLFDYDPKKVQEAEANVKETIKNILDYQSEDGETPLTKLDQATEEYNAALAEYQNNSSSENKDKLDEAKQNFEEAKETALELANDENALFATEDGTGQEYYRDMVINVTFKKAKTAEDYFQDLVDSGQVSQEWANQYLQRIKEMSPQAQAAFYDMIKDIDYKDLSAEKMAEFIYYANKYAQEHKIKAEVEVEPDATDLVEDLSNFESKISSLQTVYNSAVTESTTPSASDLQSVNDNFGGIGKDDEGNYNPLTSALKDYNKGIVENVGDTAEAQKYTNQLATAYLDLTGTLEDTIDEYGEYAEEILEAQGIENAEDVVQSRLNKTYKATRKNLEILAETVAEYEEELSKSNKTAEDFGEGGSLEGITQEVAKLLGEYNQETGEFIKAADIDGQFMAENWGLVEDSIHGVDGALDQLYVKLAQANAEKVLIDAGLDTSEVEAKISSMENMLAIASTWTMEPQALLDNADFMSALNACWDGSVKTAEAINAALSTIGMKVQYKTTTKEIRVAKAGESGTALPTNIGSKFAGQTVVADKVAVDDFEIVATKTGKGSGGSGARVGTSPSSSSGGGGSNGGGGDNANNDKVTEDTDETFDWIEVAIQRIEEEIARLDKVINDVYENWAKRNEKIGEKIKQLNQEIKAQTTAQEEYLRNAKKVAVNDGKELNWEDYGDDEATAKSSKQYKYDLEQYNKAVAEWATGEYQRKVREGLMSGNDIQKIANKYLVEAIQNYQELYNKSVAAGDAVKDLQIAVKDQYKQLLENIIAEYEGQITNIEKQADIINERIARTEEHGYFVDQSYYDKLVEYEKDQNKKYAEELDEAVKRFNDAVVNGKIKEGTEAWNDMYQQVQDVNKAYEESNTELVKLNNTIMQLQWDKFDWLEERLSDIANEADWLIGLLQSENNYNDKGFLNNRGFAQAGLISAQYTDATERLKRYQKQYAIVSNQLANDPNNKNIIEQQEKIAQAMRDTANAEKEAMEAMQSLVREGISKYIESLGELIDKFKESLNTEKDLYDFQKNIANQTKSISDLEKQLSAYQGDDSEETRKKRQELQKQLNDAQQQLEETEWDRYISETNQMLDDMKSGVEEYLNDQTESIIAVMNNMQPYIQKNGEAITKGLQEVKNDYDIKSTEHFESLGDKIGNVGSIIEDFRKSMEKVTDPATNGVKGIVEHMSVDVKTIADGMITLTNSENHKTKSSDGSDTPSNGTDKKTGGASIKDDVQELFHKGSWQKDDKGDWYQYGNGSYAANEYVDGYWLNSEGYWDSSWDGSWKHNDKGYWWEYSDGSFPKNEWLKIDGDWYYFDSEGYMVTGKQTIGGKSYTFGSNGDWLGYAKGTKASPRDQLAWTQENASELIYRTSDGAMLTPLNRGDMVFTHDMSQRLWEIAKGNIPTTVGLAVPNVGSSNVRNVTSNNNITIELPNVENYNDFKREMKQDKELEKFWQEITIGQAMGNNTLKKNRY